MLGPSLLLGDSPILHPFWEFKWAEVNSAEVLLSSIILFFAGILCSAAGIGGGGVFVAVLMVVGGLTPHNAVPLSKAIVFFGAVASLVVNLLRSKSDAARCAGSPIDFSTCRVVVPASLIGTFVGVLLNWELPERLLLLVLSVVLSFMTVMVCREAVRQHLEEELHAPGAPQAACHRRLDAHPPECAPSESDPLLSSAPEGSMSCTGRAVSGAWRRQVGPTQSDVLVSMMLMAVVVVFGILRFHIRACRAEQMGSGVPGSCQHPLIMYIFGYKMRMWMTSEMNAAAGLLFALNVPLWACVGLAAYYGHCAHKHAGWTVRDVISYQVMAATTGVLAGFVGIGGGLIFSPFFLLMGMDPAVAVATSSTCVLFTSSSTTIQYLFTDRIMMSLAMVYGSVTLCSSFLGTTLVHAMGDRFKGRRSYITGIVALGISLSAVIICMKFARTLMTGDAGLPAAAAAVSAAAPPHAVSNAAAVGAQEVGFVTGTTRRAAAVGRGKLMRPFA